MKMQDRQFKCSSTGSNPNSVKKMMSESFILVNCDISALFYTHAHTHTHIQFMNSCLEVISLMTDLIQYYT